MTRRGPLEAAGDERRADLDWLADRFVLGELPAEDERAVVDRLADDEALAAAVARSSRLVAALRATPAASVQPAKPAASRSRIAVMAAAVAAAVALVACWPAPAPRFGPANVGDGPREVVRLWRQADEASWPEEEPLAEDEPVDGDAVPDWMLAAVGLDTMSSLRPRVQEN
jgi:ferric-dicitrate binding protein FerR (iron transport regulator)